jgi:hypothetical protein
MPGRFYFHVVSTAVGWDVKNNGKVMSSHSTKALAVEAGRTLAKKHLPSSLYIHGTDGKIEQEYSYGNDPFPPRG